MINIIISNKDIFTGNKPDFFIQKIPIDEIIENVCFVCNDKCTPSDSSLIINTDKYYFGEALKYLLKSGIDNASFVHFSINKNVLCITHDAKDVFAQYCDFPCASLADCLNTKNIDYKKIYLRLAITILEMLGMKVKFHKNKIKIHL